VTAADNKFLEIDNVLKKPALEFLNYLNFYVRQQELSAARLNRMTNKQ
jgi:hypothetical protein